MKDKTALVIPDSHFAQQDDELGGVDAKAFSCVLQAIQIVKPNIGIHIGDAGEWTSVNGYEWARRKRPLLRTTLAELDLEARAVNAGMDKIDAAFKRAGTKEKHFIEGNHEVWLDNLCAEVPQLKKDYAPQNLLKLKQRNWRYHQYGKYVRFGKLFIYHGGHYKGLHHARSHVLNLSASVMYGHTHDAMTYRMQKLGGYHAAWSIGCIADMNKPFLKGRPTNWSHNFAIVHLQPGGKFAVEVVDITDGECYVYGKKVTA